MYRKKETFSYAADAYRMVLMQCEELKLFFVYFIDILGVFVSALYPLNDVDRMLVHLSSNIS